MPSAKPLPARSREVRPAQDVMERISNGEVVTAADIGVVIACLCRSLDESQVDYREAAVKAAVSKATYRQSKAKALLGCEGRTVDQRSAMVDEACGAVQHDAYVDEALAKASLEALRTRRDQLSALQSMRRIIESEGDAIGHGGYGA